MGKKGVIMDNGKTAQSSMALYWKKNREQSKGPKKQYEPTEEQQLDQRVESGFQKWKLHKEKMISKAFDKKEKAETEPKKQADSKVEEVQFEMPQQKPKGPIKIPGFKSKDLLQQKLKPSALKQVSQEDNVLKLPSHISDISQEDILRILREKKAKAEMATKKREQNNKEDVLLTEDFMESFRKPTKEEEDRILEEKRKQQQAQKQAERIQKQKEENFFKSDLLNKLAKGDTSALLKKTDKPPQPQPVDHTVEPKPTSEPKTEPAAEPKTFKPAFIPRVLATKK